MNNIPIISVVMSVYNEPIEWIRQSIDSILSQTFSDFEFIIVNDKPNREANVKLLDEYSKRDSRICIITNSQNIGLTKSLNKGLDIARGNYIARMDADDISLPSRFETQLRFLEENRDVVVCGSNVIFIDDNNREIAKSNLYCDSNSIKASLFFRSQLYHPTVLFRRIINGKRISYDEHFTFAQDYALWSSLVNSKTRNIKTTLMRYRISNGQITQSRRIEQVNFSTEIQRSIANSLSLNLDKNEVELLSSLIYCRNGMDGSDYKRLMLVSKKLSLEYKRVLGKDGQTICKDWLTIYNAYFLFEKFSKQMSLIKYIHFCMYIRNLSLRRFGLILHLLCVNNRNCK